jgi:hypothetical protein
MMFILCIIGKRAQPASTKQTETKKAKKVVNDHDYTSEEPDERFLNSMSHFIINFISLLFNLGITSLIK